MNGASGETETKNRGIIPEPVDDRLIRPAKCGCRRHERTVLAACPAMPAPGIKSAGDAPEPIRLAQAITSATNPGAGGSASASGVVCSCVRP